MHKVIFDCERMKYENTGLYHYCLNLGKYLLKNCNHKIEELTLYTPEGIPHLFGKHCKHIIQTDLHKLYMPSLKNYAVWHATHQGSCYIPFRNKNIKVVLSIHDLNFMYDVAKSEAKKQKYLHRLQTLVNRADAIVCISEHTKKDVLFYCHTNNKPLHVIYNGTNTLKNPALHSTSYKPVKPFIFSLGTITRKKNFHSLLALVNMNREMELVIAGRPDEPDYYRQIIASATALGLQDNVHLTGSVSEEEKSWYFKNCSAFAFPSISEGFGLPVAEAMSTGKPLFLSAKTALPEIGGKAAFYFKDFSETIMYETFETGMRHYYKFNMHDEIVEKGKEFCWNKAAQEYWKIYQSLF
jgi:glycosyltransferase involved in cell wall biosynthesis